MVKEITMNERTGIAIKRCSECGTLSSRKLEPEVDILRPPIPKLRLKWDKRIWRKRRAHKQGALLDETIEEVVEGFFTPDQCLHPVDLTILHVLGQTLLQKVKGALVPIYPARRRDNNVPRIAVSQILFPERGTPPPRGAETQPNPLPCTTQNISQTQESLASLNLSLSQCSNNFDYSELLLDFTEEAVVLAGEKEEDNETAELENILSKALESGRREEREEELLALLLALGGSLEMLHSQTTMALQQDELDADELALAIAFLHITNSSPPSTLPL